MSGTNWHAALVGAAMALAGLGAPAQAAEKVVWNFSLWGPPRAATAAADYFAKTVEEKTGGNFTMKLHYGEAVSPSKENLDSIKIGSVEIAMICTAYHPGKNPAMTGLDLPFLPFADLDVQQRVHETYYKHPAVVDEMKRWNAVAVFSNLLPQSEFIGVGTPPKTLEDWKGKRVRAIGGIGEAMRVLGAVPTSVPAPEVYTSLERGMVNAASLPFTYNHIAMRLHEISKWYTVNMAPGSSNCPTVVSISALNALPAEYRQILEAAYPAGYALLKNAYKEVDVTNLALLEKMGLESIRYSDEQVTAFRQNAAQPIWDKWVADMKAKGVPGEELLKLIFDTAKGGA